jgi:hypothetical protein
MKLSIRFLIIVSVSLLISGCAQELIDNSDVDVIIDQEESFSAVAGKISVNDLMVFETSEERIIQELVKILKDPLALEDSEVVDLRGYYTLDLENADGHVMRYTISGHPFKHMASFQLEGSAYSLDYDDFR